MNAIAVDLGGTTIKLAIVSDGQILQQRSLPALSENGLRPRLKFIEQMMDEMLVQNQLNINEISGIGIAFPGIVDVNQNKILSTNQKYDDALTLDLTSWVHDTWQLPLVMDNDARMALIGEWKYGAGEGVNNIVMITLGTGVGGATMINGELLYGRHYQAGCLGGHFTVNYHGNKCTCGNTGCVESEASGWSLPNLVKTHPGFKTSKLSRYSNINFEVLFASVKENDELAISIMNTCIDVWGAGIISMVHAYDPEMVIISGGIMKSGDMFIPAIQKKVDQHAWTPWGRVIVNPAAHINEAGLMGAYEMVNQLKQ